MNCVDNTCQPTACANATAQTNAIIATGTTDGATSLHVGSCNGGGFFAPEVIFEITLTSPASDLVATTNLPGTLYDTLLYLRSACDAEEIACNDDIDDGTPTSNRSLLSSGPLAAGTDFLFVDGFGDSDGAFELSVTLTP